MAGSGLLALLDDITVLLDDVAAMTKVAAVKTAGVTGDDLAVNANQLHGIAAAREIPVVKKVAWGSLKNKGILIPASLGISALSGFIGVNLIAPLLIAGGAFLCYEGVEKILHKKQSKKEHDKMLEAASQGTLEEFEKKKIKGAIQTDFVLSAEIMILTLGSVAAAPLLTQTLVMTTVGIGMTIGVYGLVGAIVKLDDAGLWLTQKKGASAVDKTVRSIGRGILKAAPGLMKVLSVLGTVAMFAVGGGIVAHYVPFLAEMTHHAGWLFTTAVNVGTGLVAGALCVGGAKAATPLLKKLKAKAKTLRKKPLKAPETNNTLKKKVELTPVVNAAAQPAAKPAEAAPAPSAPSPPSPT